MSKQPGYLGDRHSVPAKPPKYGRYVSHETLEKRLLLYGDNPLGPNPLTEISAQISVLDRTLSDQANPQTLGLALPSSAGPTLHATKMGLSDSTASTSIGLSGCPDDYLPETPGDDGYNPMGGSGDYPDFNRSITVNEGVVAPIDIATVDMLPGGTPYGTRGNVEQWFENLTSSNSDITLEFLVASTGIVSVGAPHRMLLNQARELTVDGQIYNHLGTVQRSSEIVSGVWQRETYRSLYSFEDRYYVQLDLEIQGPVDNWCGLAGRRSVFLTATWYDLQQYQFRIDWDDGQTGLGSVRLSADGDWLIRGSHAFEWSSPNDPYRPTVSYYVHNGFGWQAWGSVYDNLEITVPDANHWIDESQQTANVDGEVFLAALLTDQDPLSSLYTYTVTIDWGDGITSPGQITPVAAQPGIFNVSGFHVYNELGSYAGSIRAAASDGTMIVGNFSVVIESLRPDADPNQYTLIHDRLFTANLLFNRPPNTGRTVTLEENTTYGTLVLNPNGNFSYLPNPLFLGTDSFVYRIWENGVSSFPITVQLHVINHAPIAGDDNIYVSHSRRFSGSVFGNDRDVDGDRFEATSLTLPTQGDFTFSQDGTFQYLPEPGFQGIDQFTYRLSDGLSESNTATVTFDVGNRLPDLQLDQHFTLVHDRELVQIWPHLDPDGDTIVPTVHGRPQHGQVVFDANGSWTYTPPAGYVGSDSFSFSIYDGLLASGVALVTIDIVNRAPLGVNDSYSVAHDRELQRTAPGVLANDSDADNDALSVTLVETVKHGRIELRTDGSFSYTPHPLFVGQDSFRYVVSDGIDASQPILVLIDVESHAPEATDLTIANRPHDQTLLDNLNRTVVDEDQDELLFTLETPPSAGSLVLHRNGEYAYSPPPAYTGTVSFTYRVTDSLSLSDTGSVIINVVQNLPTADATAHVIVTHDTELRHNVLNHVRDADLNEYLTARLLTGPQHGTIAFNSNGWYSYRSNPRYVSRNESEWDRFTYQVSDGRGQTSVLTQTIAVQNNPPQAGNDEYFVPHSAILSATLRAGIPAGQSTNGLLLALAPRVNDFDFDADQLTFMLVNPATGQVINVADLGLLDQLTWNADGTFVFDPGPRRHADVEFYYAATDGLATSPPARVLIHIQDTAPVAQDDIYQVVHSQQLIASGSSSHVHANLQQTASLLFNDTNIEGDTLSAFLIDRNTGATIQPQDLTIPGTLLWNGDGTFVYQPLPGHAGDIALAYQLSDGVHLSNIALLTISVTRPGPHADNDHFAIIHDTRLIGNVAINDTSHGTGVRYELLDSLGNVVGSQQLGLNGTLTWNSDGGFAYAPAPNWIGSESFSYRIFDGWDASPPAQVLIDVNNHLPTPSDSLRRVVPGQTYSATPSNGQFRPTLLYDLIDQESDPLSALLSSDVAHGTLQFLPNGEFHYTPTPSYRGLDGFTYRISDGLSQSSLAQVVFNVSNSPAEAIDDSYQTYSGATLEGNVTFNDFDLDRDPIRTTLLDAQSLLPMDPSALSSFGQLQWNEFGGFVFTAASNYVGRFRFAYSATDGWEGTDIAYVDIVVGNSTELNRPPLARNDTLSVSPGRTLTLPKRTEWDGNPKRLPIGFNDRDLDGDALTFQLVTPPTAGQLILNADGSLAYTSTGGNGTSDSFQYRLFDGTDVSQVATVTLNIINHAPQADNGRFQSPHNSPLSANLLSISNTLNGSPIALAQDEDDDALSFTVLAPTQHGTLNLLANGEFTYLPNAGFVGQDRFTFQVSDGLLSSQAATIVISVVNDRPRAFPRSFQLAHNTPLVAQVPAKQSIDNDNAVALLAGGPFYGSLTLSADGSFTYTPPPNFVGRDTFTYYWRDVAGATANSPALSGNFATITIEVMSRAPFALPDVFNLSYGQPSYELNVLANDSDPDAKGIAIASFTQPTHGQVSLLSTGRLSYSPNNLNFVGVDRFYYRAHATDYASVLTEVTLNFTPLNLTAAATEPRADERQTLSFHLANLSTSISPLNVADFTIRIDWGDGQLTAGTLVPTGASYQIVAPHAYTRSGNYTASIRVSHTSGHTVSVQRSVAVVNTAPQVVLQNISATKRMPFEATLARIIDDDEDELANITAAIDWGDGRQTPGMIRMPAPGIVEVFQGHTYNRRGTFPVTLTLTNRQGIATTHPISAQVSHVVTVQGLGAPIRGREVDGLVGRFTSSTAVAQANQFIATIDWGDGTSSPGMIIGQDGRFEVYGTHRYATIDTYNITLLVTEDDPSQTIVHASDAVDEPGSSVRVLGRNFESVEGQEIDSSLILAELVDSDRTAIAADYSLTIDWGDGQQSAGTVTGTNGRFQVSGTHKYQQPGGYHLKFSVEKSNEVIASQGSSSLLVTGAVLQGTGRTITASRNRELIATFVDPAGGSNYAARIRLAPGHYLPAEVQPTPNASVVTLANGQSPSPNLSNPFERQQLSLNTAPQGGSFKLLFDGQSTAAIPYNASASTIQSALNALSTIDQVSVTGGNGTFTITFGGAHAYQNVSQIVARGNSLTGGQHKLDILADTRSLPPGDLEIQIFQGATSRLTITSTFAPPSAASASGTVEAHPPATLPRQLNNVDGSIYLIEASGVTVSAEVDQMFDGAVANIVGDASDWEAEIHWGDGEISPGTIANGKVTGSHAYDSPGDYRIRVKLSHRQADSSSIGNGKIVARLSESSADIWTRLGESRDDTMTGQVFSSASISAPPLAVTPAETQRTKVGEQLSNVELLTSNASDNAVAVIQWGDGRTSEGTIVNGQVSGSHTYTQAGYYSARITLRDGQRLAISTVEIDVAPAQPWPPLINVLDPGNVRGVESSELKDVVVAKFALDTPRRIGGLHQANIDWGDGHQTRGTFEALGTGNQIAVKGTHTYREAGAYNIAVTLLEQAFTVKVHITAIIDGRDLSLTPLPFPAAVDMPLTDIVVGEFTVSGEPKPNAKHYRAHISWGDGKTSAAKVVRLGEKYIIVASHRYLQTGNFRATITVEDGPVATRAVVVSAAITVAHTYEGGRAVDVLEGLLGNQTIPFDTVGTAQDTTQWSHQSGSDLTSGTGFQTWANYRGFANLTEDITWGDGATDSLHRALPYYTFETAGTLGNFEAWGWANNYWWGWNAQATDPNGWWGSSGSLQPYWAGYYGLGWFGWGWGLGWPSLTASGGPQGWPGYYGWGGFYGWSGYYGWGYDPWTYESINWPYGDWQPTVGSDSWNWSAGISNVEASWAYNITSTSARYDSSFNWSYWYGSGFDDWQSAFYLYDRQRSSGTTRHVFEDDGTFNTHTTFGLTRTFLVAEAAAEAPDVRPVLLGYEDEPLADSLLATFITSDWGSGIDGLSAVIDWGDNTPTTLASLSLMPDQRIAVRGAHTYQDEGDYAVTILLRSSAGMTRVLTSQAIIADKQLAATAKDIFALEEQQTAQIVVATIDAYSGDIKDLTASIDWGDRALPPTASSPWETPFLSHGEIKLNATTGKYEVLGQHTYAIGPNAVNYYDVRVQIGDQSQQPLVVESRARVTKGWTATAQARHQGFGESHNESIGGALISINTGELLLTHELDFDLSPGTSVGGNPQLVFNSATTNPRPIIQTVLASDIGTEVPSRFEARLIWDSQPPTPWTTFAGGNFSSGTDYLIAVQAPTPVRQTGVYNWTIEVRIHTSLSEPLTIAESGQSIVVVQNWSNVDPSDPFEITAPWGAGWHLSTLDRLMIQANGDVIYVNGLGFPRLFKNPQLSAGTPYALEGPVNEFGSLTFSPAQSSFTYTSKSQVRRYFNSLGLMFKLERPGLPVELYSYDDEGRLVAIQAIDGAHTTFDYSDMHSAFIMQPGGRGVGLLNPAGNLLKINEPTGSRQFQYLNGNLTSTQWGLLNTSFSYGPHERLFQVDLGLGSVYQLFPAVVQGLQPTAQTSQQNGALLIDPLARHNWYSLDEAGRLLRYSGPGASAGVAGQTETWDRNDRFQITNHSGPLGTSTFGFDNKGNLVTHNSLGQGTTTFSYDPHFNQPLSSVDPSGYATNYQLDSQTGLISRVTNAAGGQVSNTYSAGLLLSTVELNGATTSYQYDSQRRLIAELGPQNRNRYQTYDKAGNLRTIQNAIGAITMFTYDARNRLIGQTDALGNVTSYIYDPSGLLIAKVDPNGRRTEYAYDRRGFQVSVREGVGTTLARTSSVVYDNVGNPIEQRDPQGFVTQHTYDTRNRRTATLDPGGGLTRYYYDGADQLVGVVDRADRTWAYHYDALGRPVGVTDPLGRTTSQTLGWTGNVTAEVDTKGRVTTHAYDALYRRIATSFEGLVTQFEYDNAGNIVRMTDPLGRQTVYSYDLLHHQVGRQDAAGNNWITSYDSEGNPVASLDPLGRTTTTTYDLLNRPIAHLDAAGYTMQWTYDALSNVTGVRDGRGYWTTSTFDLHNRRIAETDALGNSQTYQYDLRDAMVASYDKLGRKTSYSTDALGQITSIQDPSLAIWQFSYDMAGNTVAQLDPLIRTTLNRFDAAGRLISTQDPLGNRTSVVYDAADNILTQTDALGRITTFEFDNLDRRTKTTDALGNATTWIYDSVGNVLSQSLPLGRITQFEYDALDRVTKTTNALGGQSLTSYDAVGNVASTTDALGFTIRFGYDALNRRTTVTDPLNNVTTTVYDATGNVLSVTDQLSRSATNHYDALGRLVSAIDPLGNATQYQYDAVGNIRSVKNAAGEFQGMSYDDLNRIVAIKSRDLGTRYTTYDAVGNAVSNIDGNGIVTTTAYDLLNRPISTTDALGNRSRVVYDAVGNVVETIDPLGHSTRITYDSLDRPLTSTDALGFSTQMAYDAIGNRISLTDPLENVTTWNYDVLDRVTTETNALGHALSFTYDAVGNRTSLTKRDGRIIQSTFDPLRRMTAEKWYDGASLVKTLSFTYDAASQMTQASDSTTHVSWLYDSLGRATTENQVLSTNISATLASAYDALGRRTQLVSSLNGSLDSILNFQLDRGGRLTRIEQSGAAVSPKVVSYTYDTGGRVVGVDRYDDTARTQHVARTTRSYDAIGRLNELQHFKANTPLAGYTLTWDAASRLSTVNSHVDGLSSFTYDATNQLISALVAQHPDLSFTYDANGNRTGGSYSTGSDNRLVHDGQSAFAYDLNGNLIRRTDATTGVVTEYEYDHRDRLTHVRFRSSPAGPLERQVRYAYDPLDRRISQSVDADGDTVYELNEVYVNDGLRAARDNAGDALLLRVSSNGQILSRYLHGLAVDEVLAEENIDSLTGTADVLWTLGDHQASIRDLVRYDSPTDHAAVVDHIVYDAFGQQVFESAPSLEQRFGYTGREWDNASGLQYTRRRYYDPSLARFLTPDPISFAAGDLNLYRYTGNHPTYSTDPSGLDEVQVVRVPQRYPTLADHRRGWSDWWNERGGVIWGYNGGQHFIGERSGDWVYLNSGGRATLTAVKKAASGIRDATAAQVEDRINGIRSPFRINDKSNEIGIFFGGTNQHIHDIGNVERLYNLFQGTKFYHGGIGHPVDYKAELISGGNGWGFEDGIARALADIMKYYGPGKRISIYGWSRGAAQSIELARDLEELGIPVDFLGLFDPVYSVTSAGHGSAYIDGYHINENYVDIKTPSNVKVATAIYAMNEDRSWFPATRLLPNGKTRLNLISSPGAHGEVGGHWESNMQIQQLNLRAMIEFARGQADVTFAWRGIDPHIQAILDSDFGQSIALRSYLNKTEFGEKRSLWFEASSPVNWNPYSAAQFQSQLHSRDPDHWNPGGFGAQQQDGINYIFLIEHLANATPITGRQPILDHYPRVLSWLETGLWDIYPGNDDTRGFIEILYRKRIYPKDGGWR